MIKKRSMKKKTKQKKHDRLVKNEKKERNCITYYGKNSSN